MTDQIDPNKPLKQQPKGIRDQVALMAFIDELIQEKNDPSVKPEQLPNLRTGLLAELNDMINDRLVSLLSEAKQIELEAILDRKGSNEEIDKLFEESIPNLSSEVAAALLEFRYAYLYPIPTQKTEDGKQKTEDRGQKTDDGEGKKEEGVDLPLPAPVAFNKPN